MRKSRPKGSSANLERDFELHLRRRGKVSASTVQHYMQQVRRFLKYVGNDTVVDRIGDDVVKSFFNDMGKPSRPTNAVIIGQFLRFAAAQTLPAVDRGSAIAPALAVKDRKELALRQSWAADKAIQQKEAGDDLIAKLARKVIDHYLYFQARIKGEPENLDDLYRFADECRELIETNLPLFMSLSAGGRNIHTLIDERVRSRAQVRCECGTEKTVRRKDLKQGSVQSCGCLNKEKSAQRARRHGHTRRNGKAAQSPTYFSWLAMKERCLNPQNISFRWYGGRGIRICERWLSSFDNFLEDMGERPAGKTLDRYPNKNGDYERGNCRWATAKEQANNRRHVADERVQK